MILRFYIKNFYVVIFYVKIPSNSLKSWCNIAEKRVNFKQNVKVTQPVSLVCNKILSFILSSMQLMSQGVFLYVSCASMQ